MQCHHFLCAVANPQPEYFRVLGGGENAGFNNRGSGRLQYLHRFGEVSFRSIYYQGDGCYLRKFSSNKESFIYDDSSPIKVESEQPFTTLTLKHLRNHKQDQAAYSGLKFSSFISWIKSQFALRAYLERSKGKLFPKERLWF